MYVQQKARKLEVVTTMRRKAERKFTKILK